MRIIEFEGLGLAVLAPSLRCVSFRSLDDPSLLLSFCLTQRCFLRWSDQRFALACSALQQVLAIHVHTSFTATKTYSDPFLLNLSRIHNNDIIVYILSIPFFACYI